MEKYYVETVLFSSYKVFQKAILIFIICSKVVNFNNTRAFLMNYK